MAVRSKTGAWGSEQILAFPKKSRQGNGKHTKYSATSRNRLVKSTEDKENNRGVSKEALFLCKITYK